MFIVLITYERSLEEIDKHLEAHRTYLKEQYDKGNFIASGRRVPRVGGVILSKMISKDELNQVLKKDPYYIAQVADYEIIEFIPNMTATGFDNLKEN